MKVIWVLVITFILNDISLPYTLYHLFSTQRLPNIQMEATKSRGETHCFSLSCFHRSSEVPCKSNKNRSKNLAAIQINRKSDLKKNQKQWDNLMGTWKKRALKWDQSGLMMFIFHLYFQGKPLIEDQKHSFSPNTSLKTMPTLKSTTYLWCLFLLSLLEFSVLASSVTHPYLNVRKKCPLLVFTISKIDSFNLNKQTCICCARYPMPNFPPLNLWYKWNNYS